MVFDGSGMVSPLGGPTFWYVIYVRCLDSRSEADQLGSSCIWSTPTSSNVSRVQWQTPNLCHLSDSGGESFQPTGLTAYLEGPSRRYVMRRRMGMCPLELETRAHIGWYSRAEVGGGKAADRTTVRSAEGRRYSARTHKGGMRYIP
jgi:hypothetical protein